MYVEVVMGYTGKKPGYITNKWTSIGESIKNGWLVQNRSITSWIVILLTISYWVVYPPNQLSSTMDISTPKA